MIITKKALPRRTVLRGMGTTLALPFLDGMMPALTALAQTPANPVRRLSITYIGNGVARNAAGDIEYWRPKTEGPLELSPILQPLEAHHDRLVVVTGLDNKPGFAVRGDPGGAHSRISGSILSGVHPKATIGGDYATGVTVDQLAAKAFGAQTQLPSLELSLFGGEMAGACETGYSCAYVDTVSWASPTQPLPMENNPRAVFERLFGDSGTTDPQARLGQMRRERSILDAIVETTVGLQRRLGARDRAKLADYLESIRSLEQRIQRAEADDTTRELPLVTRPAGVPDSFSDYCKLMYDLQVLAFQADLTRVNTFMMVKELSNQAYPESGVPDGQHGLSHHNENPETIAKYAKLNTYQITMFGYFLEKLQATADGDGTLLDHSLLLYMGGMGNPNMHHPGDLPVLLAGGAGGRLKGGRHMRFEGTPIANLYVAMLDKLGVPVERMGDSTGELRGIWEL